MQKQTMVIADKISRQKVDALNKQQQAKIQAIEEQQNNLLLEIKKQSNSAMFKGMMGGAILGAAIGVGAVLFL